VREKITDRILREANIDTRVENALVGIVGPEIYPDLIEAWLVENAEKLWTAWVDQTVAKDAAGAGA
jgi:hypothetical protein